MLQGRGQAFAAPLGPHLVIPALFDAARAIYERVASRRLEPSMDRSEIDAIRTMLAAKPRPVGWAERRARLDELGTAWPVASDIGIAPADVGGVPCEWSTAPGADPSKAVVYFHGGGYCSGSLASHRRLVAELGRAAGARALAVGYRLAPEHPFPAALDDALAVWQALRALGTRAADIALAGDSAGGGLTLALLGHLRDAGEDLPSYAWLISPWTDLTLSGGTLATRAAVDPLINAAYLEELASAYVPAEVARTDPRVSPLFADLTRLPPLSIDVGSAETLLDDAARLASAAGACDVAVHLAVWPHMIHAFPLWNGGLADGRRAIAAAGRFIRARMEG